jgi:Fic-DOC domain mobile mystery protein B
MPDRAAAAPWRSEDEPGGATPLSDEEGDGLRPSWVATRADLNAAEAANIVKALQGRRWRSMPTERLLDDLALRSLHKAMFGDVWTWAGQYRLREKNIGCDPRDIPVKVRDLCEDAKYWFADEDLSVDEAGCRFHRDLVAIHPFANGNGRHSRAATDLLLTSLGARPFTWGRANLGRSSETRARYIAALRAADAGDHGALLLFARS